MRETSGEYRTIKALVVAHVHRTGGVVDYETLTNEVLRHFPGSQWKKSHWAWYRYQILKGRFRGLFSPAELAALRSHGRDSGRGEPPMHASVASDGAVAGGRRRGPSARDPEVKRLGDDVLPRVRAMISAAAGDDPVLRFKLNRWVFARLMLDERRVKQPIKQRLWAAGSHACQACGERFASLKRVELHRKDAAAGYSVENCELLCRQCHEELG